MVVRWSPAAEERLRQIFMFYLGIAGRTTALKIFYKISEAADSLASMPLKAPIEPNLSGRQFVYRSLVVKKLFKVVYFIDEKTDCVVVSTVHDCRRNPARMREEVED